MTLDAAGFLLVGLGSFVRARELLAKEQGPDSRTMPYLLVDDACDMCREALEMLKEESCNMS